MRSPPKLLLWLVRSLALPYGVKITRQGWLGWLDA